MDYLQLRGAEFERKIIKLDSGEGAEILRNRKLILECETPQNIPIPFFYLIIELCSYYTFPPKLLQ